MLIGKTAVFSITIAHRNKSDNPAVTYSGLGKVITCLILYGFLCCDSK
ncbi:MAG: hypothetical protein RL386_1194 [Bacteroidota bacterium]|jgi:hypothetical protein